jgi:hypothetical protein
LSFENLSGIFPNFIDGNLQIAAVNTNPIVMVIGTAARGDSDTPYTVNSVSEAASAFGKADGTLTRTLYEAVAGGALNLRLFRIGASAAKLTKVGAVTGTNPNGVTIETVKKDANAGYEYSIYYKGSDKRLYIYRVSDGVLIYDNNPTYPSAAVDLNELSVSGTLTDTTDIGTSTVPVVMALASGLGGTPTTLYTAGSNGILQSRMELFEKLYGAYKLLENAQIDLVIPANTYLDDVSIYDMTTAEVTAVNTSAPWAASSVYPTPGTYYDVLGAVFAQEYQGEWYFWWDLDRDGIAEIYPTGCQLVDKYGVSLGVGDFHEANFGYQLADFCFRKSEDDMACHGAIGMLPPVSWSLKDVSNWVGRSPVSSTNTSGADVITTNGSGLLGNKWMAGRVSVPGTGLPGQVIGGVDGLRGGGFIGTDDGWPDGAQQIDRNDHRVDIGKYLSVVSAQVILANTTSAVSYAASGSAVYCGFVSSLNANSAPTNKVQPGARLPFRVAMSKLDELAGAGYVMFVAKPKGVVVSDAPTAARTDSDYRRLTTFRIVKATIDAVRAAGEPFLGEGITGHRLAALQTAIEQALHRLQKGEYLQRYDVAVTSTPAQQVQGKADVELVIVPAFELRQITVNISLSAQ